MKNIKKNISLITALLLACLIFFGSAFDFLNATISLKINVGNWQEDIEKTIIKYLNDLNPKASDDKDNISISTIPYISDLIFKNAMLEKGKLLSGNVKDEYKNFNLAKLKELISNIDKYINNFLTVNTQANIAYKTATVSSANLNLDKPLIKGETKDFLMAILTADLTEGYWSPLTFSLAISAKSSIVDYLVELLYLPPNGLAKQFSYQYRFVDNNFSNTTIVNNSVNKSANNLLLLENDYSEFINIKKQNNLGVYLSTVCKHSLGGLTVENFSRFISGSDIGIGELKKNKSNILEQTVEKNNNIAKHGLYLIGKPNGNKVELRLSITDRGEWNKKSFKILPIIIRISRGEMNLGDIEEVLPIVEFKAYKGDVWL